MARGKLKVDTNTAARIGAELPPIAADHDTTMAEIGRAIAELETPASFGNDEAGKTLRQAYEQQLPSGASLRQILRDAMTASGRNTVTIGAALVASAKGFAQTERTNKSVVAESVDDNVDTGRGAV